MNPISYSKQKHNRKRQYGTWAFSTTVILVLDLKEFILGTKKAN